MLSWRKGKKRTTIIWVSVLSYCLIASRVMFVVYDMLFCIFSSWKKTKVQHQRSNQRTGDYDPEIKRPVRMKMFNRIKPNEQMILLDLLSMCCRQLRVCLWLCSSGTCAGTRAPFLKLLWTTSENFRESSNVPKNLRTARRSWNMPTVIWCSGYRWVILVNSLHVKKWIYLLFFQIVYKTLRNIESYCMLTHQNLFKKINFFVHIWLEFKKCEFNGIIIVLKLKL